MNDYIVKVFQKIILDDNGKQIDEYYIKAKNHTEATKLAKEKVKNDNHIVNFYVCSLITKD